VAVPFLTHLHTRLQRYESIRNVSSSSNTTRWLLGNEDKGTMPLPHNNDDDDDPTEKAVRQLLRREEEHIRAVFDRVRNEFPFFDDFMVEKSK